MYVVAVSGGVDSMVLLDVLRRDPGLQLIVAHFDHGIRPDSDEDRRLVQKVAKQLGLAFEYEAGRLGPHASEEVARQARYDFLHRVREAHGANAIVTAHHQDDLLETAIHNLLRGSGRLGMISLRSREVILRPLLHISKAEILACAKEHELQWREDSTNVQVRYRRNYIRHKVLPRMSQGQKDELLQHIRQQTELDAGINRLLSELLSSQPSGHALNRQWFIMLPHQVSREVLAAWLRQSGITELSSDMLERLVVAAKTYRVGTLADIDKQHILQIGSNKLEISKRTVASNAQKHSV